MIYASNAPSLLKADLMHSRALPRPRHCGHGRCETSERAKQRQAPELGARFQRLSAAHACSWLITVSQVAFVCLLVLIPSLHPTVRSGCQSATLTTHFDSFLPLPSLSDTIFQAIIHPSRRFRALFSVDSYSPIGFRPPQSSLLHTRHFLATF